MGNMAAMDQSAPMTVLAAGYQIRRYSYRTPIKFGGRVVTDAEVFEVTVRVGHRDGREATGWGAMPLGNAWAWPSTSMDNGETLGAMRALAKRLVLDCGADRPAGHPLDICHRLAQAYSATAGELERELEWPEPMPRLAQLVSASPLEAALFDAHGKLYQANSYDLLEASLVGSDLSSFLGGDFEGEDLSRYTRREPKSTMPLYHLVGALDPLTAADVAEPVGDGLPETLQDWVHADGLTHFKIKLAGDDLAWDLERVLAVEQVVAEAQRERQVEQWFYSADFNEKCPHVEYLLDFLHGLSERAPAALDRLQYLEQPTHRDLKAHPENRMHAAARIKPVVIDESLVDFESLQLARELGYTGVALKACKGHHEALLMGAAAQKYNLFLCVQDLTCVGYSFLHSASLAARIKTVAAIEGNGRQYCPAGNRGWDQMYPGMFDVQQGRVGTAVLTGPGLFGCGQRPADEPPPVERGGDV